MHSFFSTEHKSIIEDELVPSSTISTILQHIFKFSIMHILFLNSFQSKYFEVKLSKQSITARQSISNNIIFTLFVFDNIRKRLNKFNPLCMTTIQLSLTTNMLQRFMIGMNNKFFRP